MAIHVYLNILEYPKNIVSHDLYVPKSQKFQTFQHEH